MSYTYLQDAGAESSAASFSDITLFAPLKSNPTAAECSCNGSGMACCHGSQSGMMSEPSTVVLGGGGLMWSAADSPARTSQPPEAQTERDSPGNEADFGLRCSESFARWHRESSSWKTAQRSLFGGLEPFSDNWPRWGMMRSGECSRLETLAHDTNVTGYGYSETVGTPIKTPRARSEDFGEGRIPNPFEICKADGGLPRPEWVENLMGWPDGWTGLQPLETDRFPLWLRSHGAC